MKHEMTYTETMQIILEWFCMEPDKWIDYDKETRTGLLEANVALDMVKYYPTIHLQKYFLHNLDLMLKQMVEDGYLKSEIPPYIKHPLYSVTMNAKLFLEKGGYTEEKRLSEELRTLNYQKLIADVQKVTDDVVDYPETKQRAKTSLYVAIAAGAIAAITLTNQLMCNKPH
jgi:hypothetical protein